LDISVYQLTAYGSHRVGAVELSAQLGYAFGDIESEREAFETIESNYDLDGLNAQAMASYTYNFAESYYLEPLIGVQYSSISTDAYTEAGGLNLSIGARSSDYFEGRIGARLGTQIQSLDSSTDFFLSAALVNDLSGDAENLNIGFANQSLSLSTLDMDESRIDTQAGFSWISTDSISAGVTLDGKFSDTYTSLGF